MGRIDPRSGKWPLTNLRQNEDTSRDSGDGIQWEGIFVCDTLGCTIRVYSFD